jgi:hypothetical protein
LSEKLPATVPLSLLEVSRVVVGVGGLLAVLVGNSKAKLVQKAFMAVVHMVAPATGPNRRRRRRRRRRRK